MSELFSAAWIERFKDEWNREPELSGALGSIGFNSVIAYGFDGEDPPRALIKVENGKVVAAGPYAGETPNWDLRASPESWREWLSKGMGAAALSLAFASRRLKFKVGDYVAMIKDPRMAGPFIKSFAIMGRAGC